MNTEDLARTRLTQDRQHDEHIHESMLNRTSQELATDGADSLEEEARERLAQDRQQDGHTHETMLSRAEAEVQQADE